MNIDDKLEIDFYSTAHYGILIAKGGVDVALPVGHLEHAF